MAFLNKDRDLKMQSWKNTAPNKLDNSESLGSKKLLFSTLSLVLICLSLFVLVSFLSYKGSACVTEFGYLKTQNNSFGIYGICVSEFFFNLLGKMAYLIPFIFLYGGYLLANNKKTNTSLSSKLFTTLGVILILFFVSPALWDLWHININEPSIMGKFMLDSFLKHSGIIGTNIILLFTFAICLNLIFKVSWLEVLEKTGQIIFHLFSQLIYKLEIFLLGNIKKISALKPKNNSVLSPKSTPKNHSNGLRNQLKQANTNTEKSNSNQNSNIELNANKADVAVAKKPAIKPLVEEYKQEETQKTTYTQPKVNLLKEFSSERNQYTREQLNNLAKLIETKLADFKIGVRVVDIHPGPVITRFELELDNGVKVSQVSNLSKDLARSLSLSSVRIVEVIPGKPYIGIEIPNQSREMVSLKEIIDSGVFNHAGSPLTIALGKEISGKTRIVDLATMPHLLVAGTTGSGKSVAINAMILSILYKATPDDVKLILIDPKMIELSVYEDIPHLITPVVTNMEKAFSTLQWCVYEMNRRYKLMTEHKFTHINEFNEAILDRAKKKEYFLDTDETRIEKMPFIVVFIDEFADLILVEGKKIENLVARLAGKARAAGIHLVVATQRPSVNVITGVIKANIPTRIAFQLPTKIDSRTILEQGGAEQLLGKGDMLYLASGAGVSERIHGAFVSRDEVKEVVEYWKAQCSVSYHNAITTFKESESEQTSVEIPNPITKSDDEDIYKQAVELVIKDRRASISYVQRKLQIGYNRSANLIEKMQEDGIVSPPAQNGNRNVLVNAMPNIENEDLDNN